MGRRDKRRKRARVKGRARKQVEAMLAREPPPATSTTRRVWSFYQRRGDASAARLTVVGTGVMVPFDPDADDPTGTISEASELAVEYFDDQGGGEVH